MVLSTLFSLLRAVYGGACERGSMGLGLRGVGGGEGGGRDAVEGREKER